MDTKVSAKARTGAMMIALMAYTLFNVSCEKSPVPIPLGNQNENSEMQRTPGTDYDAKPMEVININHMMGKALFAPDYSVTVYDNMLVRFTGRRNVGTLGTREFTIDITMYQKVIEMFETAGFFAINDNNIPYPVDAPEVTTTFTRLNPGPSDIVTTRTLHDFYSVPKELVVLRQNVEDFLGINKFINPPDSPSENTKN